MIGFFFLWRDEDFRFILNRLIKDNYLWPPSFCYFPLCWSPPTCFFSLSVKTYNSFSLAKPLKPKHHKNCERCPGHSLTVNHQPSMSWFKSGIVNCVTKLLNHSKCLWLCLCPTHVSSSLWSESHVITGVYCDHISYDSAAVLRRRWNQKWHQLINHWQGHL